MRERGSRGREEVLWPWGGEDVGFPVQLLQLTRRLSAVILVLIPDA